MRSTSVCGVLDRTPRRIGFRLERGATAWTMRRRRRPNAVARTDGAAAVDHVAVASTTRGHPRATMRGRRPGVDRISPPCATIVRTQRLDDAGSRFVPTCGCASIRISAGAPCATRIRRMRSTLPALVARV
jgi:hypothetical protein